jgi:hypothetical protein
MINEKIGNSALFTGRKKELRFFLNWIDRIKPQYSKSMAILSRRKTGKTALMQRLYNLTYEKNDGIIPFYYEIKESRQWLLSFSKDFLMSFLAQYMAFKTRNSQYHKLNSLGAIKRAITKEGFDYLLDYIEAILEFDRPESIDLMWSLAIDAPRKIAEYNNERVVQMIDEFQYLNRYIYWDQLKKNRASELAGSYLHTAEYKNAPLLVSGSWVGWLMDDLMRLLPGRFILSNFSNMPEDESIEMVFKYASVENVPVTYETASIIATLTEGNPFYISALFYSQCPDKNFSSREGLLKTLHFETLDDRGMIKNTWNEYIQSAINQINDKDGKKIILYICKNKHKEVTREDIRNDLSLSMTDQTLEKRMNAFVKSDIIDRGTTNFDYKAVQDNIFDKVFRGLYEKEIEGFDPKTIQNDYKKLYKQLMGKYSQNIGKYCEYSIIDHLKYRAFKYNKQYKAMFENLPQDFEFVSYQTVWSYSASPIYKRDLQIDIFARASHKDYSFVGEVKNRGAKFSIKEAKAFVKKADELKLLEKIDRAVLFVFSSSGFFKNTIQYFKDNHIAWSSKKELLRLN